MATRKTLAGRVYSRDRDQPDFTNDPPTMIQYSEHNTAAL